MRSKKHRHSFSKREQNIYWFARSQAMISESFPCHLLEQRKLRLFLMKCYLLSLLVNERRIEPIVVRKANQFPCFEFRYVQSLDMMNFLEGAPSLDSFLKAYMIWETKIYLHCDQFKKHDKLQFTNSLSPATFFSRLRNNHALRKLFRLSKVNGWYCEIQESLVEIDKI